MPIALCLPRRPLSPFFSPCCCWRYSKRTLEQMYTYPSSTRLWFLESTEYFEDDGVPYFFGGGGACHGRKRGGTSHDPDVPHHLRRGPQELRDRDGHERRVRRVRGRRRPRGAVHRVARPALRRQPQVHDRLRRGDRQVPPGASRDHADVLGDHVIRSDYLRSDPIRSNPEELASSPPTPTRNKK